MEGLFQPRDLNIQNLKIESDNWEVINLLGSCDFNHHAAKNSMTSICSLLSGFKAWKAIQINRDNYTSTDLLAKQRENATLDLYFGIILFWDFLFCKYPV